MQAAVPKCKEPGVEHKLAELANGERRNGCESLSVVTTMDQCSDIVVDELVIEDLTQRDVGERDLCGHTLALRPSSHPGQLISGLLLIGPPEQLAQVGEHEGLTAQRGAVAHGATRSAGTTCSVMSVANRAGSPATKSRHSGKPSM
ncbi:unannotated protein [freshwater metagenome]|uniref:Unannotated protein n=1 Tax=freshwater metagenome TaxID=449393 RepID=A0A6J7KIW1_9ZZZZ